MDIAVVTSVWGEYGKYLPAWAQSITAQQLHPAQTVIVDAGCTSPGLDEAVDILTTAGIPVTVDHITYTSLGAARNHAVSLADTEWCMHLDADDTLLPRAIKDIAWVHKDADVVSIGAIHQGQARVFPGITAEKILARKHGVFSCGAFRKTFWQKRPWHTHNDWVDSTFWVGLAHLGARFVSTGRVGFNYVVHDDSVSHALTPEERRQAKQQWLRACEEWTLN